MTLRVETVTAALRVVHSKRPAISAGLAVLLLTASSSATASPDNSKSAVGSTATDCSALSPPRGSKPTDRATVMTALESVQRCYAEQGKVQVPSSRYGVAILLLVLAVVGALTIAAMLFWNATYVRSISVPIAIAIALASVVVATLIDDGPNERTRAAQSRLQQAKWHWTVRMTRSSQMDQDSAAIEEAIAATDEFVSTALPNR